MTDANYTDITVLLDRSGSMQSIKSDMEGGFASFIEEQKKLPGKCRVSLYQFSNEWANIYTDLDIAEVPPLVLNPLGMTALLDSLGGVISATGRRLTTMSEDERPGAVMFLIITDGAENASREYSVKAIKHLIEEQENKYSWNFIYLGANQDAIKVADGLGIPRGKTLTYSTAKVGATMDSLASSVSRYRSGAARGMSKVALDDFGSFTEDEIDGAV